MAWWSGSRGQTVAGVSKRRWAGRRRCSGQSVAEFALVLPVLVAILGGIIQFGLIFWAQNTLTQVVRDTGRWAATQQCSTVNPPGIGVTAQANLIASHSSLLGYTSSEWTTTINMTDGQLAPDSTNPTPDAAIAAAPNTQEGIWVAWVNDSQPSSVDGWTCPPGNNLSVYHVTIRINHSVPVFFPGMQYLPGIGQNGKLMLSSTAQFRVEPAP